MERVDNGVELKLIVVDVNFRNHGIGTKLLTRVEELVENNKSIMIEIGENNFALKTLCEKLGYVKIDKHENTLIKNKSKK